MGMLRGETALVTGGASGIGRAVVEAFIDQGARVMVCDINPERLNEVAQEFGSRVETMAVDVTRYEDVEKAVALCVERFGALTILVANAGIGDKFTDLATIPGERLGDVYREVFDINVQGILNSAHAALPYLAKAKGAMVVTLSNASFWPDGGGAMYVASKHAALGLMRQMAHEFAPHVRVNAVAPGATETNFSSPRSLGPVVSGAQAHPDMTWQEIKETIKGRNPMHQFPPPQEHTGAYVFLASSKLSPTLTGTVIQSDGGLGVRGFRRVSGGEELLTTLNLSPSSPNQDPVAD